MIHKKIIICFFITIALSIIIKSCSYEEEKNSNEDISLFYNDSNIDSLRKRIFKYGDTLAYEELRKWSWEVSPRKIMFESEIMSKCYNYGPAYDQLYYCYVEDLKKNGMELSDLDSNAQNWLKNILLVGIENGCEKCKLRLE